MIDIFRQLSSDEEESYREWARENYIPGSTIPGFWHPVVCDECRAINRRQSIDPPDTYG